LRILILDDDRSYGALLASATKKLGHRAIVKVDAQEAVQMLRNEEADIALVDLEMPNGTGTAFAKTLRQNGITVPVAFCTGTCRDLQLIEEAESMGQVLPKIWTHADLRVILSSLQLESNSINRIRAAEADNNESTEPDERHGSFADGSNEHHRKGRYSMPVSLDSSQEISRHGGSRPGGSRPGEYRPSSQEIARPGSREISRGGSREDLRPPQMRQPTGEPEPPLAAPQVPATAKPAGKHAGLSAEERARAQAPTAAPPIDGLPPPLLAPEPLELVDAIPPPLSIPPPLDMGNLHARGLDDAPALSLDDPPSLELGDPPPLELADPPVSADSSSESRLPPDLFFDPMADEDPLDGGLPDVPTTDRASSYEGAAAIDLGAEPLTPPNPFQAPTPALGPETTPPKKRLETMLEVGEALRETPRVNIGCSNWEQVRRLCGDVMRGMTTITVRARCEMRAGEDVMVALELPDEMVVSIAARVLDFRERSADGKRPYQLDLIGFGSDEISYLLASCDANSTDSQQTQKPVQAAPIPAPSPAPASAPMTPAANSRIGSEVSPPAPGAGPPGIAMDSGEVPAAAAAAAADDQKMPAIPDAIDAIDADVGYEDKGPSISWS
jgi:CheY-like chemotaxis protein